MDAPESVPAYRRDGWPLCPQCGHDELWSARLPARPSDPLTCYLCDWRGTVPVPLRPLRSPRTEVP